MVDRGYTYRRFFADVQMYTDGRSLDPQQYLSGWSCGHIQQRENNWADGNNSRACNETYDQALAQLPRTMIRPERDQLVPRLNDIAVQDFYEIPLVTRGLVSAHANPLVGVRMNAWDSELWNIAESDAQVTARLDNAVTAPGLSDGSATIRLGRRLDNSFQPVSPRAASLKSANDVDLFQSAHSRPQHETDTRGGCGTATWDAPFPRLYRGGTWTSSGHRRPAGCLHLPHQRRVQVAVPPTAPKPPEVGGGIVRCRNKRDLVPSSPWGC